MRSQGHESSTLSGGTRMKKTFSKFYWEATINGKKIASDLIINQPIEKVIKSFDAFWQTVSQQVLGSLQKQDKSSENKVLKDIPSSIDIKVPNPLWIEKRIKEAEKEWKQKCSLRKLT